MGASLLMKHMYTRKHAIIFLVFAEEIEKELCNRYSILPYLSRAERWAKILEECPSLRKCLKNSTSCRGAKTMADHIQNIYAQLSTHIHSATPLSIMQVRRMTVVAFEPDLLQA